jgi:CRP-like cAMP-binding protein
MGHKHIHDNALLRLDRFAIRELDLFKPMTGPEMEAILRQARILRVRQGQAVFRQGDTAHHFYLLLEGRLKVLQVTEDGHQIVVRIVNRGELFGIAKALRRPDYPGTATAAVDSTALAWSSSSWEDMTARHPALTMNALHMVARHMQELHSRIREFSTEDVESRLAHALVRLTMQAGRHTADGIIFDFPVTRQDIAEMIGTTVPTVSRMLNGWAERGLVDIGRLRIVVREPRKLFDLVKR